MTTQPTPKTSSGILPMRVDPLAMRAQYRAWLLRDGADEETLDHLVELERVIAITFVRDQLEEEAAADRAKLLEQLANVRSDLLEIESLRSAAADQLRQLERAASEGLAALEEAKS